jgi:protein-disulfide isomerase
MTMDPEIEVVEREELRITQEPARKDNLSIPIAIVIAGILIAGSIIFTERTPSPVAADPIPARPQVGADSNTVPEAILALRPDDHVFGNRNAKVLMIEYSDMECPFCKRFHDTMTQVMDTYGASGEVAWVYRHFPLDSIHPKARKEAEALECAGEIGGNDAFWKFMDETFLISPTNNGLDLAKLPEIAAKVGVDVARFNSCLASGKYAQRVQKDFEDGVTAGVKGTPFTIVYNRETKKQMVINGAYPLENVKTTIGVVSTAAN